jgi:hypothetical protein
MKSKVPPGDYLDIATGNLYHTVLYGMPQTLVVDVLTEYVRVAEQFDLVVRPTGHNQTIHKTVSLTQKAPMKS